MITIGSDCHLKTSTMSVFNDKGIKVMRSKLNNDPPILLEFIRQFPGQKQFAMETCYNWPVFYELLKDEVDEFHLLHAKKLKSIIQSQSKCDNYDSDEIARLTHSGYIPKAYIANAQTRQLRRLLRTRVGISLQIAGIKNKIHAIVNANTFYCQRPKNFKNLFCKRGLEYLSQIPLGQQERFIVEQLLDQIQSLQHRKAEFDKHIGALDFHSEDLKYLRTVPAMNGRLIKYIVLSEIDNISRFRNSHVLIAYAGLIPKNRSSGDKIRKGRLRTECNEFLKWAMLESVLPAIRKDRALRQLYKETRQRLNSSSAKLVVARRLLASIYHVLKERRPYYSTTPEMAHSTPLPSGV
jgi:transposase